MRLRLAKENIFISHLEFVRAITRALRRSGLPVEYTGGYHPRVKVSAGPALALGVKSRFEYVDIYLTERVSLNKIYEKLNSSFPAGISLLDIEEISPHTPPLAQKRYLISYRFSNIPVERLKRFEENNLSPIKEIRISPNGSTVEVDIEVGPHGGLNPIKFLKEVGGIEKKELSRIKIEKVGFREIQGNG